MQNDNQFKPIDIMKGASLLDFALILLYVGM